MKHKITFIFFLLASCVVAQPANDTVIFNTLGHYYFTPASNMYSGYTPVIDRLGRNYVYLSTKEDGLVIFDISNTMNPVPALIEPNSLFNNLKVSSIVQDSIYLLVSLGDFESGQTSGLAILDITNPASPIILDEWDSAVYGGGVGQVIFQGNYAYLAGMTEGFIILDISNKQNIQFVSRTIPDPNFGPHAYTYHTRGLFISHDTLLVANDNGGLHVFDVLNKQNPIEIGKFSSPAIEANGNHQFYNHIYRRGNFAFCAMDYCSWSVVDVSNPQAMTEVAWLNSFNAQNAFSWYGSAGHTNEIAYDAANDVMFVSGAASNVVAFDPTIPNQPRMMGEWGSPLDSIATWGVDVFGNLVASAVIHNPNNWPYVSNEGGLQLLGFNYVTGEKENSIAAGELQIYPNPSSGSCTITLPASADRFFTIETIDVMGRVITAQPADARNNGRNVELNLEGLSSGIYSIRVSGEHAFYTGRLVKE